MGGLRRRSGSFGPDRRSHALQRDDREGQPAGAVQSHPCRLLPVLHLGPGDQPGDPFPEAFVGAQADRAAPGFRDDGGGHGRAHSWGDGHAPVDGQRPALLRHPRERVGRACPALREELDGGPGHGWPASLLRGRAQGRDRRLGRVVQAPVELACADRGAVDRRALPDGDPAAPVGGTGAAGVSGDAGAAGNGGRPRRHPWW